MAILDYESVETYLGDRLRRADCLDVHADHFFPVTLLDLLFHYSEEHLGAALDEKNRKIHRNFHGHDFDRWIDNLVARTRLALAPDEPDAGAESVELIDIDSLSINEGTGTVEVILPDETTYRLLDGDGSAMLSARSLDDIDIHVDIAGLFDRPPVDSDAAPYMGFGMLAHVVRVACDKSGIDPAKVDPHKLSVQLFNHFKNELLDLIPSLWNDMEHLLHYTNPTIHEKK